MCDSCFRLLVLPLPAPHLRCGSGRWDLGSLQQGPGTQHTRTLADTHFRFAQARSFNVFVSCLQVVEDVTEFYKQTYNNYKDTRQEALKETLRLIHFGVRTHASAHFCCYYLHFS